MSIGKSIGAATAAIVLAGMVLWGIPYYIQVQVRSQVATELQLQGVADVTSKVSENGSKLTAITAQLDSMEGRMIERDRLFMQWLQDQSNRLATSASEPSR